MPSKVEYGVSAIVSISGQRVAPSLERLLTEVVVHNHAHLPDMVEVRFRDDGSDPISDAVVRHGHPLEVKATFVGTNATEQPIFTGEVTSIETEYDSTSGTVIVLRGYDRAHRMTRGTRTKAYLNVTFGDVVRQLAGATGQPVEVPSPGLLYDHLVQFNESDWDFLQRLARENDVEVVSEHGKLIAREVRSASAAPQPGQVGRPAEPLQLVLGGNLISLHVRVSSGGQVDAVTVRGWDWKAKQPVEARAEVTTETIVGSKRPADLAAPFARTSTMSYDPPLESQGHATVAADAIAERIAASSVEVFGSMQGDPQLKAGAAVSLAGAGGAFDGRYLVTSSRHVFTEDGFRTEFEVSGRQDRSLLALGGRGGVRPGPGRVDGVVTALVTNNDDREGFGRVKVKFPWLADDIESDWARLAMPDAGPDGRGCSFVPEVNDEVLVAFEHGDFRRPYVVGRLWNGQDTAPPNVVRSGQVVERGYKSRTGHRLVFNDDPAGAFVEVVTAKGFSVRLDDQREKITLTIGQSSLEMTSTGNVTVKGNSIVLDAQTSVEIKAPIVKANGSAQTEIKGGVVRIN